MDKTGGKMWYLVLLLGLILASATEDEIYVCYRTSKDSVGNSLMMSPEDATTTFINAPFSCLGTCPCVCTATPPSEFNLSVSTRGNLAYLRIDPAENSPYAIDIMWGDHSIQRYTAVGSPIVASHKYEPGIYHISVVASGACTTETMHPISVTI